MESQKSLKKQKSKKPLVIALVSLVVLLAGAAAFYFLYWRHREPVVVLTDAEYLAQHSWEKSDAPTVIWTFRTDGSGELTTNKSNYYNFTWTLEPGDPDTLAISTAWLLSLDDSFDFSLDREADSFTVKNRADDLESTFVPLGTAEAAASAAEVEEDAE